MIVFDMEKFLNDRKFKQRFPESGEDIKVMASRVNSDLQVTVAMAFVDRFVKNEVDYFRKKEEMADAIHAFLQERYAGKFNKFDLSINTLDQPGRGVDGTYMTVTGTSADSGDCGQVGRGNRANGVISLNRPASEEAAAGKNPVSHVGKIYNLLSFKIAKEVYEQVSDLDEVYIWLLSQIGRPIDDPKLAAAQIIMKDGDIGRVKEQINNVIFSELENIGKFTSDLSKGKYSVC
jgi:S-adenosylmethionine synthetase